MKVMRLWTTFVCAMTIGTMCTYGVETVASTNEVGKAENVNMPRKNKKLKCLDLFSGAGGFSLGFTMAGCEIIGAVEIDKWAAETFQYNHPKAKVIVKDITQVTNDELLEAFPDHPDIIVGGPPCQGFSICRKNAGDPKDPRNSLFVEYLRVVALLKPSVVVVENVPNILNAKTKAKEPVVSILHAELEKLGYHVEHTILNATDYGVPQSRQRFVLIGSKKKLARPFPQATHYVKVEGELNLKGDLLSCPTLWDAISDLPDIEAREGSEEMAYDKPPQNDYQRMCREGSTMLHNHLAMKHTPRLVERFSAMKWGESISDIKDDRLKQRKRNGNGEVSDTPYDQNNRRQHPYKVCNTVTATFYGNFVHPFKNRNFTAREGARIQSFPDWYVFRGKPTVVSKKLLLRSGRDGEAYLCQYSQIGNAVPPLVAKAIAANIIEQL